MDLTTAQLVWTKTETGYEAHNGDFVIVRTPGRRFKLLCDGLDEYGPAGSLADAKDRAQALHDSRIERGAVVSVPNTPVLSPAVSETPDLLYPSSAVAFPDGGNTGGNTGGSTDPEISPSDDDGEVLEPTPLEPVTPVPGPAEAIPVPELPDPEFGSTLTQLCQERVSTSMKDPIRDVPDDLIFRSGVPYGRDSLRQTLNRIVMYRDLGLCTIRKRPIRYGHGNHGFRAVA